MSIVKQLYQLQEIDLEIESGEQAMGTFISQLGESEAVARTQAELTSVQQRLEELIQQQHPLEWEIENITVKIKEVEEKLYSGRINNPKELTNLQNDVDSLKARRSKSEDKALETMEQVELTTASVATTSNELKRLEAEWERQQQQLTTEIERLKAVLANLKQKRQLLSDQIDPQTIDFYQRLRKQRGRAVAKVEQGICRGCQIQLPTTDLQQARSGGLVQCSSCGRILYQS